MGLLDFITKSIPSSNSVLGVDIGTTSIKAVEMKKGSGGNPVLINYGLLETLQHFERENDIIQARSLEISVKQVSNLLKILMKKANFKSRDAIASVASFSSYTNLVEMPQMSDEETKRAMSYQIQQHIPLSISEVAVDWLRVGAREDENGNMKQLILIIAIPNKIIEKYREAFKMADLNLKALEVEYLSYSRSVAGSDKTPSIILDIGARSTNITFVEGGFVKDNSQIDYGGDHLTQAIARGLGVSMERAEALKRKRGLTGTGGEFELSTLQKPFLDVIINEVIKEKAKFESSFGMKMQRVVLVGGGSDLMGIDKYIEDKIELPTVIGNGLLYVSYSPALEVVSKEIKTRFATAIGLAIRRFI